MSIIENFLVNTNNFEPIIQALIEDEDVPSQITDSYFKSLGFQNPSDLLVIHLLKGLNILEEDGSKTELFSELKNPETTPVAIAKGVIRAYEDLFEKNPKAHKMQPDELKDAFSEIFQGKKTDLILKYMTNTFTKLVSYAGLVNIENALGKSAGGKETDENTGVAEEKAQLEVVTEVNGIHKNGTHAVNGNGTPNGHHQEEGNISFEDLVGLNSTPDSETPASPAPPSAPSAESAPPEEESLPGVDPAVDENEDSVEDAFGISPVDEEQNTSEEPEEPVEENNIFQELSKNESDNIFEDFFAQKNAPEAKPEPQKEEVETAELPRGKAMKEADEKVQKAIVKKADLLYKLNRHEEVLPALEEIITYFANSDKAFLKEAVSRAVIQRAMILCKQQKFDQALPALNQVISRFAHSDNKEYYEQASVAMLYKAQILESQDQLDQALPLFNSIVDRLGNSTNPKIRQQVDSILLKRLDILLNKGDDNEVLAAADQVIARFRDSEENLRYLEEAMFKKAEILEKLNRNEEALKAYSDFLDKFGNSVISS